MTKSEWDRCFAWLLAIFPTWQATPATAAAWYREVGALPAEAVMGAVRQIMSANPSPFPPGVFEIRAAACPTISLHPGPEAAWGIALGAQHEARSVALTGEIAEALGACREQLRARDAVGARMAFLESYRRLIADPQRAVPRWFASLGHDPIGRADVEADVAEKNARIAQLVAPITPPVGHIGNGRDMSR